jgi:hypothetical protein
MSRAEQLISRKQLTHQNATSDISRGIAEIEYANISVIGY